MNNLGDPARVQYNDFTGTVAADESDPGHKTSVRDFMIKQGLITERDHIHAVEFFISTEISPNTLKKAQVSVVVSERGIKENEVLRGIHLSMAIEDIFKFFKQFKIALVYGEFEKIRGKNLPVEYEETSAI